MKVNMIKKVIVSVFIAALFLVPVSIVMLQINSKNAKAYNPYVDNYSYSLDDYLPVKNLKSGDNQKTKNNYCQNKYDTNYVFRDWYCVPNSLDFSRPKPVENSDEFNCIYSIECTSNGSSCVRIFICTEDYTNKLTDFDCKNVFGRNYKLSEGQCLVNSLDFDYNYGQSGNYIKSMDCIGGYIDLGAGCVEGFELSVPKTPSDEGVGSIQTDFDLFPEPPFEQDGINLKLPEQDINYDPGFWNL
jgi:hypothetical protein